MKALSIILITLLALFSLQAHSSINLVTDMREIVASEENLLVKINMVNTLVNRSMKYKAEESGSDFWQSPKLSMEAGSGDCEDYVLLKEFLLKQIGLHESQMKIIYTYTIDILNKFRISAHLVLGIALTNGQYLILDNLTDLALEHVERKDLEFILSADLFGTYDWKNSKKLNTSFQRKYADLIDSSEYQEFFRQFSIQIMK